MCEWVELSFKKYEFSVGCVQHLLFLDAGNILDSRSVLCNGLLTFCAFTTILTKFCLPFVVVKVWRMHYVHVAKE